MQKIRVERPFDIVVGVVLEVVKEDAGIVEYGDPSKGVFVVRRRFLRWDAYIVRVIDITAVPGGCLVGVHSATIGSMIRLKSRMEAAERRILEGLARRVPCSAAPT